MNDLKQLIDNFFFCEGDDYEAAIFRMFSKTLMLHNSIKSAIEFTIPG